MRPEGLDKAGARLQAKHGTMEDDLLFIREVAAGLGPPGAAERMDVRGALQALIASFNEWKASFRTSLAETYRELVEDDGGQ